MSNAPQALSALAGGVVGFFIGGPAGALAGFQYGLLAGSLLFPTQLPGVTGPRLEDFERAEADPGAAVWKAYGRVAVPGFRMYLGPVTEIANTEEVGGKGAPTQEVTTFTYTQTLALGLCEGVIPGILRIWENGKIVYDLTPQAPGETAEAYDERVAASLEYQDTFVLYLGDELQEADPTLEAELGAGNVPGFRGLAYLVFPDRTLKDDQAQRHPAFKIEIGGSAEAVLIAICMDGSQRVARSTDAGETWTMIATPFAGGSIEVPWQAIAFSPTLQRIVAVGDQAGSGADRTDTMYSDDNGLTWTRVFSGVENGGANDWKTLLWISDDGGFFLASAYSATSGAVAMRKSVDGVTWTGIFVAAGGVGDVCYSPQLQRIVAAIASATANETDAAYSDDFGETWTVVQVNLTWDMMGHPTHTGGAAWDPQHGQFLICNNSESSFFPPQFATSPTALAGQWTSPATINCFGTNGDTARAVYMPNLEGVLVSCRQATGAGEEGELALFTTAFPVTAETPLDDTNWLAVAYDSSRGRSMALGTRNGANDVFAYKEQAGDSWTMHELPQNRTWTDVVACVSADTESANLADIVTALCSDAGITDIDVSEIDEIEIPGYAVTSVMNAVSALNPLRMVGLFDYVESGETLRFPVRGAAAVATIDEAELGPALAQDAKPPAITTRKLQDVELPLQIRLRYLSLARDYERGEQLSPARIGTVGVNLLDVDCAVVLEDDRAAQLAEIIFREAWASRWSHTFQLDASYHALEPADVLLVPIDGRTYRLRVVRTQDSALILRKLEAVRDDDGAYTSTAVATPPIREPNVLVLIGETEVILLDLPALQDAHDDPGFYYVVRNDGPGSSWTGARLHKSVDNGSTYTVIGAVDVEGFVGTIVSHPAGGDAYTWDNDSEIVIDMEVGTLQSRTDAAVLAGANALAIGADGRWHIAQFADAELVSPGRYRLTRLLLGRRGTEHLIAEVQVGDRAVLVSGDGVYRYVLQTAEIGAERLYRPVSAGKPFSSGATHEQTFTGTGEALETFAPVYVRGDRDDDEDLLITWIRRDRLSQTLTDGVPVPMNETSEAYEIDILDGVTVVRTLTSSIEQVTYTAAQQTVDFGSPQASVAVRIYQLSAVVGRGTPAEATL